MGFVDRLAIEALRSFLDNYPKEVEGLRKDLERLLDKKRRGRWGKADRFAVNLVYNYVCDCLEKFKLAYLGHYGELPTDIHERLERAIEELDDLNAYIVKHFEDDLRALDTDLTLEDVLPFLR